MKMVETGAPQFVKLPNGKYRLEVPVDFEFEDQQEREDMESAFKAVIEERKKRLRGER